MGLWDRIKETALNPETYYKPGETVKKTLSEYDRTLGTDVGSKAYGTASQAFQNVGEKVGISGAGSGGGDPSAAMGRSREGLSSGYSRYAERMDPALGQYNEALRDIGAREISAGRQYQQQRSGANLLEDQALQRQMERYQTSFATDEEKVKALTSEYTSRLQGLGNEAASQATDARQTYKGTIQPEMLSTLDRAKSYEDEAASQAMSLSTMMDPSNAVQQGYRDIYGQQYGDLSQSMADRYSQASAAERADLEALMGRGVDQFGSEIEGTRKRGLADTGILQALGAQATGMMASDTATAGQMAALAAQQQRGSSEAYAQAQQRMRSLEDQRRAYQMAGLERMGDYAADLRRGSLSAQLGLEQEGVRGGLEAGRYESGAAYDRGYQARSEAMDRTAQRLAEMMGAESQFGAAQAGLRGEQAGYGSDIYSARGQQEQLRQQMSRQLLGLEDTRMGREIERRYGNIAEDMALGQQSRAILAEDAAREMERRTGMATSGYQHARELAGMDAQEAANIAAINQANTAARAAQQGQILGAIGTVAGAYFGGPAGAAAGGAAGRSFSGANAPVASPAMQQQTVAPPSQAAVFNPYQRNPYAGAPYQQYPFYGSMYG